MKAYSVTDVRPFMKALFSDTLFNSWQFRSAELSVLSHITIDGTVNSDYLTEEERLSRSCPYLTWEEIQPRIRALIQGSHTPTQMNIVLAMDPTRFKGMPEGVLESLLLNIRYETSPDTSAEGAGQDKGKTQTLTLVTGVSTKTFTMDKGPERLWDESIPTVFKAHGIPVIEI